MMLSDGDWLALWVGVVHGIKLVQEKPCSCEIAARNAGSKARV